MKIVYLTSCFATQSHTFIRREIDALRALGVKIALFGIRKETNLLEELRPFADDTNYLYPLNAVNVISANLRYFVDQPAKYLSGLIHSFMGKELTVKRRLKMTYHYLVSTVFAEHFVKLGVSHIHAHFMNVSASIAMHASWHSGVPFSITVHSAGTYGTPHILGVEQKLTHAKALIMISHNNINYFEQFTPCRQKSSVVRCGMDLESFTFRDPLNHSISNPLQILAIGRFVEKKGFKYLIQALANLKRTGVNSKLTLVGSGPLEFELKTLASKLSVEDIVDFAGQQSTSFVKNILKQADVVVVPSVTSKSGEQEGLPVVIMEAMASGVPVIATEHSGIPEIVVDGLTGTLVNEKDPDALSSAIANLLVRDIGSSVKAAAALVNKEFNIEVVAQKRLALFSNLSDSPNSASETTTLGSRV